MKDIIEQFKTELKEAKAAGGEWQKPYIALMQEVYKQDVLFVALSRENYDKEKHTSTPLISTKDFEGQPSIYIFSDLDVANAWMQHYHHATEDMTYALIGGSAKSFYDFSAMFQVARVLGTKYIMLDEGANYVGIGIDDFFVANSIDPKKVEVPLPKEQAQAMLRNEKGSNNVQFAPVNAIPLKKNA